MSEELFTKQRDILFEACKKVATNKKCPPWISEILRNAVMEAKNLKEEFPSFDETEPEVQTLNLNDIVIIESNKTSCKAKLIEETDTIQNIRMFNVQVIETNANHQKGQIFHNIPETFMRKIRG